MLVPILGSLSSERVLIFILTRREGYAREIARFFETDEGFVYVLKTDTYTKDGKEIIKIGFTAQDINQRINQLYTTGVPFKFKVHAVYQTKNFIGLETALHKLLDPFKLNKSREFFIEDALAYIEKIVELHKTIQGEV